MDVDTWLEKTLGQLAQLPDEGSSTTAPPDPLHALVLLRASGGVDALADIGALRGPQLAAARELLASKGVTKGERNQHLASSFVTGAVSAAGSRPQRTEVLPPQRLREVLAVGRVMGLVDDEPLTMTAVEVWDRSVRAGVLLTVGEQGRRDRDRAIEEWVEERATEPDGPPAGGPLFPGHPGSSLTWVLETDGVRTTGRLVSGSGTGSEWRQDVAWSLALPDPRPGFTIEVLAGDRVVGRQAL